MKKLSFQQASANFHGLWEQVLAARKPVAISRAGAEPVIMLPLSEWRGMQEALHLVRSPANAVRLLAALQRAADGEDRTRRL